MIQFKMGLISDRKNKAKKDKNDAINGSSKSLAMYPPPTMHLHHHPAVHHHHQQPGPPPSKRGIFGPQVLPTNGNGMPIKNNVPKYPAGYYTTPVHSSSSSASWGAGHHGYGHHPAQPKYQPNVNPRYQTWVAPQRKQPSLQQLVRIVVVVTGIKKKGNCLYLDG